MKLESQVVSLELSKQLKEVGYKQEGLFSWCKSIGKPWNARNKDEWGLQLDVEENEPNASEIVVAPTVAELGERLPAYIKHIGQECELLHFKDYIANEYCIYIEYDKLFEDNWGKVNIIEIGADTEANARAKMWIYLKKEGLI